MLTAWHTAFATQAEVGATLTGLVFVALALNLTRILATPGLPGRAGEALLLLLTVVFGGLAGTLPQTIEALGAELIVIAAIAGIAVTHILHQARDTYTGPLMQKYVIRVGSAAAAVIVMLTAGALLVAGESTGLWCEAAASALSLTGGVAGAWVLLVEILR